MPAIHAALANAYSRFTAQNDRSPGKIDAEEALELIDIARDINSQSSGCCGFKSSKKGDQGLSQLVKKHGDHFDRDGLAAVQSWLKNHRAPDSSTTTTTHRPDPSRPVDGTTPTAPTPGLGKVILEWKASKPTWHCHWFPMQASQPGGDVINNLYANGGALEKYDAAFGKNSKSFELANNAKAHNSVGTGWFGHCNNASQVAALLREPIKDVTMNGQTFTAHDISGLLCKVIPSLCTGEDFKGGRYNGPSDDPNDPNPVVFLDDVLKAWCKPGQPAIILDIDRGEQVWNYPFDQARVYESDKAPEGFNAAGLPRGGKAKFYRAELKGTGFKDQERNYQFWIQYDSSGKPMERGWIAGEDSKVNPDFAWRSQPVGDLNDGKNWKTNAGSQNNPNVFAEDVFKLYRASIA